MVKSSILNSRSLRPGPFTSFITYAIVFLASDAGCKWPSTSKHARRWTEHANKPHVYRGQQAACVSRFRDNKKYRLHTLPLSLRTSLRGGSDDSSSWPFLDKAALAEMEHNSFPGSSEEGSSTQNALDLEVKPELPTQRTELDSKTEADESRGSTGKDWKELAMAAWRRDISDDNKGKAQLRVPKGKNDNREKHDDDDDVNDGGDDDDDVSLGWRHEPDPSYDSGELAQMEEALGDDEPWDVKEPEGGDADELFEEAVALHEQGGDKLYEAERLYRRILMMMPSHIGTLCNYGSLCFDFRKDFVSARRAFRRALRLQPDDMPSLTNYADMLESAVHVSTSAQSLRLSLSATLQPCTLAWSRRVGCLACSHLTHRHVCHICFLFITNAAYVGVDAWRRMSCALP
jgi:hypothetical protein